MITSTYYRGYTLQTLDTYKVQIWTDNDCICTEDNMAKAIEVIDYWRDGASR